MFESNIAAECKDILEFSDEFASGTIELWSSVTHGCFKWPKLCFLILFNLELKGST
jgi:hypothetical protein